MAPIDINMTPAQRARMEELAQQICCRQPLKQHLRDALVIGYTAAIEDAKVLVDAVKVWISAKNNFRECPFGNYELDVVQLWDNVYEALPKWEGRG